MPLADDVWREFEGRARQYCGLIEEEGSRTSRPHVRKLLESLLLLTHAALALPECLSEGAHAEIDISIDCASVQGRLHAELESVDLYQLVPDPHSPGRENVTYSMLSDDLADIYRNLMEGIRVRDLDPLGPSPNWHWKFSFETHWGHHAVSAITAMHSLLYGPCSLVD